MIAMKVIDIFTNEYERFRNEQFFVKATPGTLEHCAEASREVFGTMSLKKLHEKGASEEDIRKAFNEMLIEHDPRFYCFPGYIRESYRLTESGIAEVYQRSQNWR